MDSSSVYITQERPELSDLLMTWIVKPCTCAVTSSHLIHLPNLLHRTILHNPSANKTNMVRSETLHSLKLKFGGLVFLLDIKM